MAMDTLFDTLLSKEKKIAVVGLGYVGLPLALEFGRHFSVVGFDIDEERIEQMRNGEDPSNELEPAAFLNTDIHFTSDIKELEAACFYVISVPTDIDEYKTPNLKPLIKASETVGRVLIKGDYVVYESTVYPGCTEDDCVTILERESGLERVADFKFGYSPERINPGDKERTLTKILKIVSACDEESLDLVEKVYDQIIDAGIYTASSVKVAEAAKVIENTQRDINIALMNELSMIFDKMGLDTLEVLEAAGTKWNFLKFFPGLVGGHCIGVDPYYLTFKAKKLGYNPKMILSGRFTNEAMPAFIAKRMTQFLIEQGKNPGTSKVLLMGLTFKENVSDIRNSKVADLVKELESFSLKVDISDPFASAEEVKAEYGFELVDEPSDDYDAIIVAVSHYKFRNLSEDYFIGRMNENPILFDLKGIYRKSDKLIYWRL